MNLVTEPVTGWPLSTTTNDNENVARCAQGLDALTCNGLNASKRPMSCTWTLERRDDDPDTVAGPNQ